MKRQFITVIVLFMFVVLPVYSNYYSNGNNGNEYTAKYYDNAKVVRVKYAKGESFVSRGYNEGVEEATVNLSIFEGDAAGTTDGRMEIYLGKLNYLRLDYDTDVKFTKLPALRRTRTTLQLRRGGIILDVTNIDDERDIVVQTEDCGLFILRRGLYRINARENGRTEVYVYDGLAEVAGTDYSRNIRENQKVVMREGRVLERPFYFYESEKDDFDRWNKTRMNSYEYMRYGSSRYMNRGYEDQEYELTRSGRWTYNAEYNTNVWIPYNVGSSWRPYSNGRWIWHPVYGYVWNSYDSWGYYTHHYGRWHWSGSYGWYWLPGYRWSPAWVSWYGDSSYWGWCPLSYYNTPVVVINGRWNRGYRYQTGIPWKSRSMIIIRKNQLMAPRINRVSLSRGSLSRITKRSIKYRGTAPRTAPVIRTVSVINAKGLKVAYKRNGLISYKKYKNAGKTSVYKRIGGSKVYRTKNGVSLRKSIYKYSSSNKIRRTSPVYKSSTGLKYKTTRSYRNKTYYKNKSLNSGVKTYRYKSSGNKTYSKPSTKYKSSYKKTYSNSGSSRVSSYKYKSSKTVKKIKKKKNSPYAYNYNSGNSSSYSYKSYKPTSYKYKSKSSNSYSYGSHYTSKPSTGFSRRYSYKSKSYSSSNNNSYSTPSYKSKRRYSVKSYSSPSSSYKSYSRPTTSYRTKSYKSKSYNRPSTSYKSYSKPTSTYRKSYSSSSSSSSSSHSSYKKKR